MTRTILTAAAFVVACTAASADPKVEGFSYCLLEEQTVAVAEHFGVDPEDLFADDDYVATVLNMLVTLGDLLALVPDDADRTAFEGYAEGMTDKGAPPHLAKFVAGRLEICARIWGLHGAKSEG